MGNPVLRYFDYDRNGTFTRRGGTLGGGPVTPPPGRTYLLNESFDTRASGPMTVSLWNTIMAGGQASGNTTECARHNIVANTELGGKMIDLTLLAGQIGSAGATAMGIPLVDKTRSELWFEIQYKFVGAAFDFQIAGKLPGLSWVKPGIGITYPGGCKPNITDEGGSARHMWESTFGMPDYTGATYLYGFDSSGQNNGCGEEAFWYDPPTTPQGTTTSPPAVLMTPNVWHTTTDHIRLNTPGVANGVIQTWHDGTLVYDRSNRQQRSRSDALFGGIMWDIFYGGSNSSYAPDTDQHIYINDVKVWYE